MDFLIRAEKYAETRGDENWFKEIYSEFRLYNDVTESVWKTLSYLYDDDLADLLKEQK